ncbi:MAG TPA: HAD family phosphatase [Vicinamibacteria bacterium]|nr:HAD family phosphatase [Vicinamibacteria bacterium]
MASREAPVRRGLFTSGGRPYGAALLDLDGTLIDSNDAHARAWSRALARFGHRVSASRIRRHIGKGGSELLREFVTRAERHFRGEAMGRTQTKEFLKGFARIEPFEGAARAVREMRRAGVRVVLASSADRRVVERALRRLRLDAVIDGFTCADDVEKAKPFEDVFSLAIARFRLAARRPVAIGDTPYDIAAAHQLGVPCIALFSGGFPRKSLASADARFEDMAHLWRDGRRLFA